MPKGDQGGGWDAGKDFFNSKLKLFINFKNCTFSFSFSETVLFQVSAHDHNSYHSIKPHFQNYKHGWLLFFRLTEISLTCLILRDLMKNNTAAIQHLHFHADNTYQVDNHILCWEITTRLP